MANGSPEPNVGRWWESFAFIRIFRSFGMAAHPLKLGLALVGIILTWIVGGVLDRIWVGFGKGVSESAMVSEWVVDKPPGAADPAPVAPTTGPANTAKPGGLPTAEATTTQPSTATKPAAATQPAAAQKSAAAAPTGGAGQPSPATSTAAAAALADTDRSHGIFEIWWQHERYHIESLLAAARRGDVFGGPPAPPPGTTAAASRTAQSVAHHAKLMLLGVRWIGTKHYVYAFLFLSSLLLIWSLLGGAICRIAAVEFARDEKPSSQQALGFAREKWVGGFFAAAALPVGLILVIMLFLWLGGVLLGAPDWIRHLRIAWGVWALVIGAASFAAGRFVFSEKPIGRILQATGVVVAALALVRLLPWLFDLIGGLLFILALAGGFALALVVIGTLAGGNLFWPTIAAEGSDSFDAISRSFSYVFSRPWRTAFYGVVALIYGSFCFVIVQFIAELTLRATHYTVGAGTAAFVSREGGSKLDALWTVAGRQDFHAGPGPGFQRGADWISYGLIWFWVHLVIAIVWAFLISYYFSASTVVYFLLRREVDATDLDDVYLDAVDDDDGPPPGPVAASAGPATGGGTSLPVLGNVPIAQPPPAAGGEAGH